MKRAAARVAAVVVGLVPAALAYAALLGLGLHRRGAPWAISTAATVLVFAPPLVAGSLARGRRAVVLGVSLAVWSTALLVGLPVYFPGERQQAVATGLAVIQGGQQWERASQLLAEQLPDEPEVAEPEVPVAAALVAEAPPPAMAPEAHQIPLPFEGEGRRMSVPVAFEHDGTQVETWMMLDTGATYTTLSTELLARLGISPGPGAPVITLHTANGEREAQVVLVDRVWLGDLFLDGVAIATCEACSSSDTEGLLGLNVAGNYNMTIDADRREVLFSARSDLDRRLDAKPFTDLDAHVSRFSGGRVEVDVALTNRGPRDLERAAVAIHCDQHTWEVPLEDIPSGEVVDARRRLPRHEACEQYRVSLHSATW